MATKPTHIHAYALQRIPMNTYEELRISNKNIRTRRHTDEYLWIHMNSYKRATNTYGYLRNKKPAKPFEYQRIPMSSYEELRIQTNTCKCIRIYTNTNTSTNEYVWTNKYVRIRLNPTHDDIQGIFTNTYEYIRKPLDIYEYIHIIATANENTAANK